MSKEQTADVIGRPEGQVCAGRPAGRSVGRSTFNIDIIIGMSLVSLARQFPGFTNLNLVLNRTFYSFAATEAAARVR